ncbi:MAG TPA: hypothetical protein VNF03_10190 [Patescibacteria group bacterium]|nr:hypothetical protein [Patescibacteria group bacterium]
MARVSRPERVLIAAAPAAIGPGWLLATRGPLLVVLVLGLVTSISLSQITLGVLTAWLFLARRAGVVPRLRFPLAVPLALFAAWTVVAALGSAQPLDSLLSSKGLLNLAGLWIVASVLGDSLSARRFLTTLAVALGVVAALSIVQVAACPPTPPAVSFDRGIRFFRNCQRAHGFFSIYMTLAGILSMVLIAPLSSRSRRGSCPCGWRAWWPWR